MRNPSCSPAGCDRRSATPVAESHYGQVKLLPSAMGGRCPGPGATITGAPRGRRLDREEPRSGWVGSMKLRGLLYYRFCEDAAASLHAGNAACWTALRRPVGTALSNSRKRTLRSSWRRYYSSMVQPRTHSRRGEAAPTDCSAARGGRGRSLPPNAVRLRHHDAAPVRRTLSRRGRRAGAVPRRHLAFRSGDPASGGDIEDMEWRRKTLI